MKTLSILLFLCLSCSSAFSNDIVLPNGKDAKILSKRKLIESVIVYSTKEGKTRYSYTYDSNGNQLTYLIEKWQNEQWINSERATTVYDSFGHEINCLSECWVEDHWSNNYRYTSTYNLYGKKLTFLFER
ncbi:MAG: hypothetical protein WCT77_05665, partial [Bacteroidota bacterium]